jgi:predicted ArsR family transcriptional regulator
VDHDSADLDRRLDALANLGDPVRRALYRYVISQAEAVGRDEAAGATGVSRSLAAYHLDKLTTAGLLDVRYERRSGRSGPGAGRPAKLYLRARDPVEVAVPPRAYELIALLLADAVAADPSGTAAAALIEAARTYGLGLSPVPARNPETGQTPRGGLPAMRRLLESQGYEPYDDEQGVIRLRNCPFDQLAAAHRDLVCGANLALIESVIEAQGVTEVRAVLDPRPDRCCVALVPASA